MTAMSEATVAAHAAIRILDAMTRQNESLHHSIVTAVDMLERLEAHIERIDKRLEVIERGVVVNEDQK